MRSTTEILTGKVPPPRPPRVERPPLPCAECPRLSPAVASVRAPREVAPPAAPAPSSDAVQLHSPEPPREVAPTGVRAAAEGDTACIVPCHNYGRYLRQCLDSLLAQTLPFAQILVVDDASSDDTAGVAAEFAERGIRYLRGDWHDFTLARRAGVEALPRPRFLLFVDADNWLDPRFHEHCRAVMGEPRLGVAYATIRRVDATGNFLRDDAREFDYHELRRGNYADACALIRFETYEQTGGWRPAAFLTDWRLWLDATRAGWLMRLVPPAILHYREHGLNMSAFADNRAAHVGVMRAAMITTIMTLFAGRAWQLARYAEAIRRLAWDHAHLRIVAVDNSGSEPFYEQLRDALASTGVAFTILRDEGNALPDLTAEGFADHAPARTAHPRALSVHLARLYSLARASIPAGTDFVWCLEDDIEPPAEALEQLCAGLWMHHDAGVVSGAVRSRFEDVLLAWASFDPPVPVAALPAGYVPIAGSGFMCTLFRRQVWDQIAFRPAPNWDERHPYYDWAASMEVRRLGWTWLFSGDTRCRHWQADGTAIEAG